MRLPWRVPRRSAERRATPAGVASAPAHHQAATSAGAARTTGWCACRRSASLRLLDGRQRFGSFVETQLGRAGVARTDFRAREGCTNRTPRMQGKYPEGMTYTQWRRTPFGLKHRLVGLAINDRLGYWRACQNHRCRRGAARITSAIGGACWRCRSNSAGRCARQPNRWQSCCGSAAAEARKGTRCIEGGGNVSPFRHCRA
jgi:hypothetical protein